MVRFDPDLYNATEGVDDHVTITLVALQDHEYAFNVTVISKAGTAARKLPCGPCQILRLPCASSLCRIYTFFTFCY